MTYSIPLPTTVRFVFIMVLPVCFDDVISCVNYVSEDISVTLTSLLVVNLQFIFSTAIDGKIKAWLYDNLGSRVDYDAPGRWCTTMLYSADGSR